MNVPAPLEITASLMAGYRFTDGSLLEVDSAGDYRITNATGEVIDETVDSVPGEGHGLRFGVPPADYGEIMDTLAAFLCHDGELFEAVKYNADQERLDEITDELVFGWTVAEWAYEHGDELSTLACYQEDRRLEEE